MSVRKSGTSRGIAAGAVLTVLLWLAAACGSGGATANTASAGQPTSVQVTLTDFKIQSSLTSFKVGVPYHFVVTNKGQVPHELMILPPTPAGTSDQMAKTALADITSDHLAPGATSTVDVTFSKAYPAGTLEMACHLPGHYEAGMHLPITVQ